MTQLPADRLLPETATVEQRVRDEIWKMRRSEDMPRVLQAVEAGLRELGVVFDICGVNIVETLGDGWQVHYYNHIQVADGAVTRTGKIGQNGELPIIVGIWRDGEIVYRPDLDAEDRFGERRWIDNESDHHTRAVVDAPFAYGTLALAAERPDAFSAADLAAAGRMAAVLGEGFSRREDLQKLEREIAERQRAEEEIRTTLAVQRVRNVVLQMENEADWDEVAAAFNTELSTLVDFYLCGIQHIDELKNAYRAQDITPPKAGTLTLNETVPKSLRQALETGRYVYRRNRADMERYGDIIGEEAHSVLDVPFRGGTVAINSLREDAFSEREIHILERFAQVMSEAHLRLEDLTRLREREEQLRQAQKMEAIGQLTAGIAHNFNNALSGATVNLYLARSDAAPAIRPLIVEAERAIQQASDMVRKLLTYSRRESQTEFHPLELMPLLQNVASICRKTFDRRIVVEIEIGPSLPLVAGDATQLEQMMLNLCLNARDALAGAKDPAICVAAHGVDVAGPSARAGAYALLRVSDNGVGMDEDTRAQIFNPFFTTKSVDAGTGLGLSTVYGIAQQHGGWIECESRPGEGAVFSAYLPVADASRPDAGPVRAAAEVPTGAETILLVDDEEHVRMSIARLLQEAGYRVLTAVDGPAGLEVYGRQGRDIGLVILDLSMPRMSGGEVLEALRRADPQVKVMIFSGYAPEDESVYEGAMGLVEKPPKPELFLKQVRAILDAAPA